MWGREQRAATQHFPSHQLRASIAVPRGTGSCCNVEPSAPVWVPAVLRYTNISVPTSPQCRPPAVPNGPQLCPEAALDFCCIFCEQKRNHFFFFPFHQQFSTVNKKRKWKTSQQTPECRGFYMGSGVRWVEHKWMR